MEEHIKNLSLNENQPIHLTVQPILTARDIVLQRCGQVEPISFEELYPESALKNCRKIGEGVYGEVFLYRNKQGTTSVMKIIPIEGELLVNGEHQKKFEEILTEIVISSELSNLRNGDLNATRSFVEVRSVKCVQGRYPNRLIDLWELYDEDGRSENDNPSIFDENQLYIILELANGGEDLESFVFNNAFQAFSVYKQVSTLFIGIKDLILLHKFALIHYLISFVI